MPFTEQQQQEFMREYAQKRRRQLIVAIPFFLYLITVFVVFRTYGKYVYDGIPGWAWVMLSIFIVVFMGVWIFALINWRCPACNKYFGRAFNHFYCSKCGVRLR